MKNIYKFFAAWYITCSLCASAMANPVASASATEAVTSANTAQIETKIKQLELERLTLLQAGNNGHASTLQLQEAMLLTILLGSYALALRQLIKNSPAQIQAIKQATRNEAPVIETWERTVIIASASSTVIPGTQPQVHTRAPSGWIGHHLANDNNLLIEYEVVALPERETADPLDDVAINLNDLVVEEQTDPLPQAQFWAALGKVGTAIEILEPIHQNERTPHCWLMLMEMYNLSGQRGRYEKLCRNFKSIFNGQLPPWDAKQQPASQRRLYHMPDLMQRINRILPGNGVIAELHKLLLDDRKGKRQGFEYGVYCDLVRLYDAVCNGEPIQRCEDLFIN